MVEQERNAAARRGACVLVGPAQREAEVGAPVVLMALHGHALLVLVPPGRLMIID